MVQEPQVLPPAVPIAAGQQPAGKPALPPGVEADVGNGLVTKPIAWWDNFWASAVLCQLCLLAT